MRLHMPTPSNRTLAGLLVTCVVALLAFWVFLAALTLSVSNENDDLERRTDESTADRADLRADVEAQADALAEANRRLVEAGEKPVAEPEPGEPGRQGIPGLNGEDGADGPPGPAGRNGRNGAAGTDGRNGVDGTDGADGVDGQDGAPGAPGRDGKDGADGQPGADGRSAFPFTFTFTVQTNPAQATTYSVTCTVDGCTVTEAQ